MRSPTWRVAARAWIVLVCAAQMRRLSLATVLVVGASHARAQPVAGEPSPTPTDSQEPASEPPKPAPVESTSTSDGKPEARISDKAVEGAEAGSEPAVQPAIAPADVGNEPAVQPAIARADRGFRFGSYGRIVAGTDLRGGKPDKLLIVAHGPRIVEPSYLELELSYGFERVGRLDGGDRDIVLRPVITVAFDGTLFHDTGEFEARPALRNVYLDAHLSRDITVWAGSRMYRGDDIYLFDYWPLDDQNTVGAGAQFTKRMAARDGGHAGEDTPDELSIAAHVGFNRLDDPFQYQQIDVPNPVQGATTVDQLDRQRIVTSASAAYTMMPRGDGLGAKLKVHSEIHALSAGEREREDGTLESLPADGGFLVGAQAGVFGFAPRQSGYRRHLNLFARYARGLAAFDELAPPTSFGPELKTTRASEVSFGLSGNFDHAVGQLMLAALSRRFVDADTTPTDPDDGWEYAVGARPLARVARGLFAGADVSYQARFPRGLNPITLRAEDPAVFQIAPMLVFSPMGPSAYDRPQLRLVYRGAHLNTAARDLYVPDDPRHGREWVHFLGVQAEWWFNSTRYR